MKFIICLLLVSLNGQAKSISSLSEKQAKIDVASIQESILLAKNETKDLQVRALVRYLGQSTDVSPKYEIYLTYFHGAEMNNTRTAFSLGHFWSFESAKRIKAGIYEVKGEKFEDGNIKQVTMTINTYNVFSDDKKLILNNFEDPFFQSTIEVTEK